MGKSKNYHCDSHAYSVSSTQTLFIMYSLANELSLKSSSLGSSEGWSFLFRAQRWQKLCFTFAQLKEYSSYRWGSIISSCSYELCFPSKPKILYIRFNVDMFRHKLILPESGAGAVLSQCNTPIATAVQKSLLASSFVASLKTDAFRIACPYSW